MDDGTLRYQGRLCVPNVDGLQERIMTEAHTSRYFVHSGSTKMYHDLKEVYWWNDMKRNVADFVARCPNCQQVKTDGQVEQTIQTLEDMLRACVIDFKSSWDDHLPVIEFTYNNSYHASIQMAPFEALYGRRCRSPIRWFEIVEADLIGPDLVHQAMKKVKIIKERLKTAQSRQKSYSDVRRRDLEFQEDDWVFLKVFPMKGVMQFGKKGKLSPRYIGPYKIIQRIIGDPTLIVPVETIEVNETLTYEEIPVSIIDRQVRKLRNKEITSVKVLWRNQHVAEATWEAEEEMKKMYPYLLKETYTPESEVGARGGTGISVGGTVAPFIDVKSAFLNGYQEEGVFVKQPPSFESKECHDHMYKLDNALYWLNQAPRAWY
ncbi:uncharacterized protein LOC142167237 [Nicotiana tabacum]|uniref:Uncharacterized protein LOC142167237 n=1 Tax=Nicotiana tabacum TaxID=4097 RepID=A0AC58SET6_TOBAC